MMKGLQMSFLRYLNSIGKQPIKTVAQIIEKKPINHDTYIYKLKFADRPIELTIGQHFRITQTIKTYEFSEGEEVSRKYTPINPCSQQEVLDVLIKIYRPNTNISFPNGGKLTPYLQGLKQGDKIHLQGPFGKFGYEKGGKVILEGKQQVFKRIFLIAGGSGITPCYQVIREIANMPQQKIELILLFANKTEADIILREQLEKLRSRVQLHYILDRPPADWKGFHGYITEDVLKIICSLDEPDTLYIYCGPFGMNSMIKKMFEKNHPSSRIFKF